MTTVDHPALANESGRTFGSYFARSDAGRVPGVVVLHDMFGLNDPIRAVADRYAQRGYAALVPNLFWRSAHPEPMSYDAAQHPAAWERLNAVDLGQVAKDIGVAADWLRAQPGSTGKVGAIGFCGGGRWAYLAAARCNIDAAASLYGLGVSQHLGELGHVKCPLQLHYGLKDEHIPKAEVDAVSRGVQGRAGVRVFTYPDGRHSFANPVRPGYDPAITALAYERIDAMFAAM
ncbi:MAG: dienelactone hydrolase family protein [Alphaproteobacteria bacterium]|nr:dienelactone hydrolase family protein [Alphaproteobacteria bacterium]